jgi:hypothetical protein
MRMNIPVRTMRGVLHGIWSYQYILHFPCAGQKASDINTFKGKRTMIMLLSPQRAFTITVSWLNKKEFFSLKAVVFLVMISCNFIGGYQYFRGT